MPDVTIGGMVRLPPGIRAEVDEYRRMHGDISYNAAMKILVIAGLRAERERQETLTPARQEGVAAQ